MNIQKIYEELISDISYTNKDFRTIYPELINIFKKFNSKWDPSVSNESDVGVMLIKLIALMEDKNNFNIDKAALENFPLSVTQLGNAQQLYDSLGYKMGWYNSATLDIGFRLTSTENGAIELPVLDTQVSDSSGSIIYTLLEKVNLSNLNEEKFVKCMEGVPYLYTINGNDLITMNNLDSNLRLYFDDVKIAENGIFIWDSITKPNKSIEETWQRVDNLASQPAKSKVFSFGVLPNSNKTYIQFPDDVATLMGSGLTIYYIISSGLDGNIKANTIDSWNIDLSSTSEESSINSNIQIIQTSSSSNGRDPETIEEAYKNYKKTIGTFDTLVTKRDYDNFIYNQENTFRDPIISNVIVADRLNDINNSYKVTTWEPGIERQINVVKNHDIEVTTDNGTAIISEPNLTPYDIVLYLLRKPDSIINKSTYTQSFKPEKDSSVLLDIEARLEDSKSVNHNIYLPSLDPEIDYSPALDDKFTYNNLLTIKGTLITYSKVTKIEANEIEEKVMAALFNKYNGREVTLGSEINYEDLVKTIEEADERIKYLVLNDNYYETVLTKYSTEEQVSLVDEDKDEVVAKMVLAGNTQLFKFQDDFLFEFGQKDIEQIGTKSNAIKSATTWSRIVIPANDISDPNKGYTIKENELIQVYHDNLIVGKEYGFYVKYTSNLLTPISPNENRILNSGETITLEYTSNGVTKIDTLGVGALIQPTFAIQESETGNIKSNQSIKVKSKNEFTLVENMPYYFILNNSENRLQLNSDNNRTYILQENEYFLYSSPSSTDLIVLGSGTKLSSTLDFNETCDVVNLDNLTVDNSVTWNKIPTGDNNPGLKTTELYIQTFGKGIKIKFNDATTKTLSNTESVANIAIKLDKVDAEKLLYQEEDSNEWKSLDVLPIGTSWYIHSRLNLYASNIVPQLLESNHFIKLTLEDSTTETVNNQHILFNNNVIAAGGTNIDMRVLNDSSIYEYSLLATKFMLDENFDLTRNLSGFFNLTGGSSESYILPFKFNKANTLETSWAIPIYINKEDGTIVDIKTSTDGINFTIPLKIFNTADNTINANLKKGMNIIQIPYDNNDYSDINFEIDGTSNDSIIVGNIFKLNGFNTEEINDDEYDVDVRSTNVLTKISSLNANNKFNWLKIVEENNKVLKPVSPEAFWNINHIFNSFTLPQINFTHTNIKVNRSSIN